MLLMSISIYITHISLLGVYNGNGFIQFYGYRVIKACNQTIGKCVEFAFLEERFVFICNIDDCII